MGAAVLDMDVITPQAELDAKMAEAVKIYGKIDVSVNNAGYVEGGALGGIIVSILLRAWEAWLTGFWSKSRERLLQIL